MPQKVIICQGIPASGKSTWAKEQVKTGGWKRINRDELRAMIDAAKWSPKNEEEIVAIRNAMLKVFLENGDNVIIDDTNFGSNPSNIRKEIARICLELDQPEPEIEVKFFPCKLAEALERNAARAVPVPDHVIREMYYRHVQGNRGAEYRHLRGLEQVILFDLDGTLAIPHALRDPKKDASTCDQDLPHGPVIKLARALQEKYPLVIVSGRQEKDRRPCEKWLSSMGIRYRCLLMRATGDNRNDAIVKKEIFERDIDPHYDIVCVFDDRKRVVDMWRELDIMCCQVAPGDF